MSTIKPNLKRKNNEILTTKTQQNMAKTQQNMATTWQNMGKTQQNLTYEKPSKLAKRENLTSQKQQIMYKNKKKNRNRKRKT